MHTIVHINTYALITRRLPSPRRRVYAFDKDKVRLTTMLALLRRAGVLEAPVITQHADFLKINPKDNRYRSVGQSVSRSVGRLHKLSGGLYSLVLVNRQYIVFYAGLYSMYTKSLTVCIGFNDTPCFVN